MTTPIRWGILGTGSIAHKFADGLRAVADADLVAVGSRTQRTADAFGDEFDVPKRHASYEGLVADPDVDIIYVSTPHPMHAPNTILCLNAGKPVLCEKPFTVNLREAEGVVRLAREKKLFLMEAMWTRYIPVIVKVREWIQAGRIGDVNMVAGDFGFRTDVNAEGRLFNLDYAGGALLDVGIYPISFASMVFGTQPSRIASMAQLGETGVDEHAGIVFGYDGGQMAVLYTAVRTDTPQEVDILGTKGSIRIHTPFWKATKATLTLSETESETVDMPYAGNG
ncbi:MAG: Gfo/Idh/MocA family oxidoreductase, partial [FCB group bacterium]|nr:Gfo/Idh/MocA family oxidoreductase [FCB group bacterium]